MDLYQLKTFFTLAKIRNFTLSAQNLFVTQSAVSHAIKKLESSVGTTLIDRRGRQVSLTRAGLRLFRACEKIFHELEKAEQDISYLKKRSALSIRVGSTVEFGNTVLITSIKNFLEEHPEIHVDFLFSHALIDPLMRDELDLIIDCKMHKHQGLECIQLFREQYVTIATAQFIKQKKIKSIHDLERINLLSMDRNLEWWNNFFTAVPDDISLNCNHVIEINHIRGMINAAICGMGIGFVPGYTVAGELAESILIDPFPEISPAADQFNIFIKKSRLEFKKNRIFISYLQKIELEDNPKAIDIKSN